MTGAEFLPHLRARLAGRAGIRSPDVKRLAAEAYREVKAWPLAQRNRLCDALWKSGSDEEGTLAVYLYQRFEKQCGVCEFRLFERWIDRYVHNWGHCDGVAHFLISSSIATEPALSGELLAWTSSSNRWKKRASAVALVKEARCGRQTSRIFEICDRLLCDDDDLVRKAVGWLLKETHSHKPRETLAYLKARKDKAPRLVLRIAAEKMTPRDRESLRAGTEPRP